MTDGPLPTEVELAFEVMPCNALRTAQEPLGPPHPCTYFRSWGTYHSYDYTEPGTPAPEHGMVTEVAYVGRAHVIPELLSGCRKAPIMAVGINPNLPGWWTSSRGSLNPDFDDVRQYAHYFRYRATAKLEIPDDVYASEGGGPLDTPFSDLVLDVPMDDAGRRIVEAQLQQQSMYLAYDDLLQALALEMGWTEHALTVGEDLSYGNMVACPSAKWTTAPDPTDPTLPPMTQDERVGIVTECFHTRRYFLRQLFQSLPVVILVFSQSTANAFIGELRESFVAGDPVPGESLSDLHGREVRLQYGRAPDGSDLEARVVFAPHVTGDPAEYRPARAGVIAQLVEEANAGRLLLDPSTGHLIRPPGACVFCPMLGIGPCDYEAGLRPLASPPKGVAVSPETAFHAEKSIQNSMLRKSPADSRADVAVPDIWSWTDESASDTDSRAR
jgi:hypothetical protein